MNNTSEKIKDDSESDVSDYDEEESKSSIGDSTMSEIKSPQRKESIGDVDIQQVAKLAKEMGILDTSEIDSSVKSDTSMVSTTSEVKEQPPVVQQVIKEERVIEKVAQVESQDNFVTISKTISDIQKELRDMEVQTDELAPPPVPTPPDTQMQQQLLDKIDNFES